jgi:hypothetical protein
VEAVLAKVDPSLDWIFQCLDDFINKSSSPIQTQKFTVSNASNLFETAEKCSLSKWGVLEIQFLEDLTNRLMSAELELTACADNINRALSSTVFAPTSSSLKRDVDRLQLEITLEQSELGLAKCSLGRHSAISCQATEQLSLHGFCIDEFDDERHVLSFQLYSAEDESERSNVILNLDSTENMLTLRNGSCRGCNSLTRQASILNDLSGSFLNMLVGGPHPLLHGLLECRDMQDCFLKIARWLGVLGFLSRDLDELCEKITSVSIELPHITLTVPSRNTTIDFAMDPITDCIATDISVSRSGSFDAVSLYHGISDWRLQSILAQTCPDL